MFTHLKKLDPSIIPELEDKTSATGKRFYKTPAGVWYPSITTVLGMKDKPYLEAWRASLGPQRAKKETDRCAKRGTIIHKLSERYLNNEEIDGGEYEQTYINDFNKLKLRLNQVDNIRGQELPLYSDRLELAGRVDCVGEYNKILSIIDFKTSTRDKYKSMIADYFLQTTAYAIMWHERTGEPIENVVIMMTVEKGPMPLVFKDKIDNHVAPLLKRIKESKDGIQRARKRI